jgi:hypothetical protein
MAQQAALESFTAESEITPVLQEVGCADGIQKAVLTPRGTGHQGHRGAWAHRFRVEAFKVLDQQVVIRRKPRLH